jgi:hypothetical protein
MPAVRPAEALTEVAERIVEELREKFPEAEYLLNGEVYGEEDVDLEIYAPEAQVAALDREANEVTFRYWEETGYNVLPMVAPKECCPVQ